MKSTVERMELKKESKYPYLGKYANGMGGNYFIVLFVREDAGTIVYLTQNTQGRVLGEYLNTWDEKAFVPYTDTVVLSN